MGRVGAAAIARGRLAARTRGRPRAATPPTSRLHPRPQVLNGDGRPLDPTVERLAGAFSDGCSPPPAPGAPLAARLASLWRYVGLR